MGRNGNRLPPLERNGVAGIPESRSVRLSIFVGVASLGVFFVYLRKLLQHLDPSRVIPERVRTTLDTFAEGFSYWTTKNALCWPISHSV